MPNGRSGSLFIEKAALGRWLSGLAGAQIVGHVLASRTTGRPAEISAETVSEILAVYPADRIAVEEQDRTAYVIHLYHPFDMDPPDPEKWILVSFSFHLPSGDTGGRSDSMFPAYPLDHGGNDAADAAAHAAAWGQVVEHLRQAAPESAS
jgi:hypothetical protein